MQRVFPNAHFENIFYDHSKQDDYEHDAHIPKQKLSLTN